MRSKVFKVWVMVLAIALASGAFACGQAEEIDWKQQLKGWDGKTIKIIINVDPWTESFEKLVAEFGRITGAKVTVDSYPYYATHEKEIMAGASRSPYYDVIVLDCPWVGEFAEAGYVQDLSPYIASADPDVVAWDDYLPTYIKVANWKGQIVGIPFGAYHVTLHYRKDWFEEAGFTPPKTIKEWQDIAAYFTDNPQYPRVYGTAMNYGRGGAIGQGWFEWIWNLGGKPFASNYPGSPDPYADMTPTVNAPEGIETLQLFIDMLEYQPPGANSYTWDHRATDFAMGKVAMICPWSSRTGAEFANPEKSTVVGKFATSVVPAKEGVTPVPPLGGWIMGINSFSREKDMAWDFVKWFCSIPIHKEFMLLGGPPSRYSAMMDPELSKKFPWYKILYESALLTYEDCRPRIPESFEIIDTVEVYCSKAVAGELTVEEAMDQAAGKLRSLLAKGGYNMQ